MSANIQNSSLTAQTIQPSYNSPAPPLNRERVVSILTAYWDEAEQLAWDIRARSDLVIESYNGLLPKNVRKAKTKQTKIHLGWCNRAVHAFRARLAPLLLPSPTAFFRLYDNGQAYALACAVVSPLLAALFSNAGLPEHFRDSLDSIALEGAVGGDVGWDRQAENLDPNRTPAFRLMTLNARDVGIFPVTEPPERCITAIRTYYTKSELIAQAKSDSTGSFDLSEIMQLPVDADPYTTTKTKYNTTARRQFNRRLGVEVKDYYCPQLVVDGVTYERDYATIVANRYLVRFVTADSSAAPYSRPVYAILDKMYVNNVGPVRIGIGLCNRAYEQEQAAHTLVNLNIDNAKLNVLPPMAYDPLDKYFDRDKTSYTGGEMVPVSSTHPRHMTALWDTARTIPMIQEQLSYLQYQFESTVGIPNFLSGTGDTADNQRVSATAKRMEANGADTRIREYAERINNQYLKPMTEKGYVLIRERLNYELSYFQQLYAHHKATGTLPGQDMTDQLPLMKYAQEVAGVDFAAWLESGQPIPPLSAVTLDLNTFESELEKIDEVNNSERALATLGQVAQVAPNYLSGIQFNTLIRNYLFGLNLGASLKPISQANQEQAQAEQQQAQAAKEQHDAQMATLQAEINKLNAEAAATSAKAGKNAADVAAVQAETAQILQLLAQGPAPQADPNKVSSNASQAQTKKPS